MKLDDSERQHCEDEPQWATLQKMRVKFYAAPFAASQIANNAAKKVVLRKSFPQKKQAIMHTQKQSYP